MITAEAEGEREEIWNSLARERPPFTKKPFRSVEGLERELDLIQAPGPVNGDLDMGPLVPIFQRSIDPEDAVIIPGLSFVRFHVVRKHVTPGIF